MLTLSVVAVVTLGAVAIVLACMLGVLVRGHQRERDGWVAERRSLVDRAIARHAGEVIAFDRTDKPKPKLVDDQRLIEGLS